MPKNILVIDDDGLVTKSLCALLNKTGLSATPENSGYDAIDKIKGMHVDLIVVDIKMPGIDGVETVKRIKEILRSKNKADIPVIFITGYADNQANLEAEKLGEVILKPLDSKEFLERINHYL
ncbi:MAG: response regulator [Candidatus Omnitrophica bacterium]|nr:response regulator [Candidatus Omnitrophota bacterium]